VHRLVALAAVTALVALALVLAGEAPAARTDAQLLAKVGPGFSIGLTDASGNAVTHLDTGTYTIAVDDESDIHNFDLTGPGVSESTSIEGTGKATWTVTFGDGTYTFICDAHPQTMRGTFTVGTGVAPAPAPTPKPKPAPKPLPLLVASVGPGQTITLRRGGALVRTLPHGRYRVTVHDRAAFHDFHLFGPGLDRKTGIAFVGTQTWTVSFRAGAYRYQCDPHKQVMHGSFRVT
jgi:plastocyanin